MKPIQANIRHLRSLKKMSQERFADELSWSRSMVGSYEEGRSEPPIDRLIDVSNYFDIPIDILVKKDLRKAKDTSFIEVGNKRVLFPVTVNENNEDLIEIIPIKASAGYLSGYDDPEYIEQLEKIENSWKIKHYVLSVSIPNEDINRVITIKKKNDSIFLKKFN